MLSTRGRTGQLADSGDRRATMSDRDTCRMPNCDRPTGEQDDGTYRDSRFCSVKCDVKYDHLKADSRDARAADMEGQR